MLENRSSKILIFIKVIRKDQVWILHHKDNKELKQSNDKYTIFEVCFIMINRWFIANLSFALIDGQTNK